MDMIDKFFHKKQKIVLPKHIAVTIEGNSLLKKTKKSSSTDVFARRDEVILDLLRFQVDFNIPIMTLYLLGNKKIENEIIDSIEILFSLLSRYSVVFKNQVRVSVLGKWYDLPGNIIEAIKSTINKTKDFDRFFLNFCINYDGQEEIVDSCRLIARMLIGGKISIDDIDKDLIKDNLYSSYFLPPDLIIRSGKKMMQSDLLLWDSSEARCYFADKAFNNLSRNDFIRALESFS